jgi:hypothetical protein
MKLVKRTIESDFLLDDYESLKIQEMETRLVGEMMEGLNKTLETIVREYSVPPIKGEITKGKLRWRGLRLCSSPMILGNTRYWIEQRGKQIGYQIIFKLLDIK